MVDKIAENILSIGKNRRILLYAFFVFFLPGLQWLIVQHLTESLNFVKIKFMYVDTVWQPHTGLAFDTGIVL